MRQPGHTSQRPEIKVPDTHDRVEALIAAFKQGEIEARPNVGLREKAPTVGEAFRDVAGPTLVGAALQTGVP